MGHSTVNSTAERYWGEEQNPWCCQGWGEIKNRLVENIEEGPSRRECAEQEKWVLTYRSLCISVNGRTQGNDIYVYAWVVGCMCENPSKGCSGSLAFILLFCLQWRIKDGQKSRDTLVSSDSVSWPLATSAPTPGGRTETHYFLHRSHRQPQRRPENRKTLVCI